MAPQQSLCFKVTRKLPELVTPAKPTPHEYKLLSDIDDQEGIRFQVPVIQFFPKHDHFLAQNLDPVGVIREALSRTLVFYYPFAGRVREEGVGRKLAVDCTGEGVLFIEADADVRLEDFGDALQPPFPCFEELLFDVPASAQIINSPLLLIQVTRLMCGGFIFASRFNHTLCDAAGYVQFITALGEIARGAIAPSVLPVWEREFLSARNPVRVTCTHPEYDITADTKETIIPLDDMVHRSFFFGPTEMAALRRLLPLHLRKCSTFEVLTACLWRIRTIALKHDPEEELRVICIVNARPKFNPPLPIGYYGNAFGAPVALTTARKLCNNPIGYALQLVKQAKESVNEDYMRSVADLMVTNGRPHFRGNYLVTDVTRAGLGDVDFGWGRAVYAGPAKGGMGVIPGQISFYISYKNKKGENGIVMPICLPAFAMERFVVELDSMLKNNDQNATSPDIISAL